MFFYVLAMTNFHFNVLQNSLKKKKKKECFSIDPVWKKKDITDEFLSYILGTTNVISLSHRDW